MSNILTLEPTESFLQDKGIQKDKLGIYSCFEHMCTHMFQLHIDDLTQQVGHYFCSWTVKSAVSFNPD
jgi:hypothetical protein